MSNSSDPDQARQNVGPDLGPNYLKLRVFLKELILKKKTDNKKNNKELNAILFDNY